MRRTPVNITGRTVMIDKFPPYRFEAREGTYDEEYVINEVIKRKCYFKHFDLFDDDVVLDIGGHIGTFAVQASKIGAEVHTYEMDAGNFALLKKNLKHNKCRGVKAYNRAVVDDNHKGDIEYGRNILKNTGAHSLYIKGGQRELLRAKTVCIDDVLNDVEPNFIKMDIEGAEKLLLPSIIDYVPDFLVMEYHHTIIKDLKHYAATLKKLRKVYGDVKAKKPEDVNKNWTSLIFAWNES